MASNLRFEFDPAQFYLWRAPGDVLSIHLSLKVVQGLAMEHMRAGTEGLPADIRGVLLGRSVSSPQRSTFIEDFVLISSNGDDSTGPATDEALTQMACKRFRGDDTGRTPIGFFRFQRDGSLIPSDQDITISGRLFSKPENVMLLVRFSQQRGTEGAFFYRHKGRIHDCVHVFPFDVVKLLPERPAADKPFADKTFFESPVMDLPLPDKPVFEMPAPDNGMPERPEHYSPIFEKPAPRFEPSPVLEWPRFSNLQVVPEAPKSGGGIRWWQLLPTAALFTIGTIAAQSAINGTVFASPAAMTSGYAAALGLNVTSLQHQLQIRWNHDSRTVRSSERAAITITDAGTTETMPISREHLLDGYVSYTPKTNDITIQLDVTAADGTITTESVQVLAMP